MTQSFSMSTNANGALISQDSNGAITTIGKLSLTGSDYGVKEIKGNQWYAIGRWDKGIENIIDDTGKTTSKDLSKSANESDYYFVFHSPTSPIIGKNGESLTCSDYHATKAQWTGGGSNELYFVNPTISQGVATLSDTGDVYTEFTATEGSTTQTYATTIRWIPSFNAYNGVSLLGYKGVTGGSGGIGYIDIGNNGSDGYVIGSIYTIKQANGATFRGSFSMVCK